jgi:Acyl-CoA dehydrogenase, N-terminal domain.
VDLRDSPDEAAFREQLRAWLRDNLPAEPGHEWSRKLYDAGYAGLPWPVEDGGGARRTAIRRLRSRSSRATKRRST